MSWFDTKGLASLAKNALKEAQKQIDKALDIQDEQMTSSVTTNTSSSAMQVINNAEQTTLGKAVVPMEKKLPGGANREKSKTAPSTPSVEIATSETLANAHNNQISSNWGSFTGSFFENPHAHEMVTTPPKASSATAASTVVKRQSMTSNSDSIELLSPASNTPSSELASPSEITNNNSESVELITAPTTTSEVASPSTDVSLPESIVIIASNETCDEDEEEDSISYNTVMDDTLSAFSMDTNFNSSKANKPTAEVESKHLTSSANSLLAGVGNMKLVISLDESQTMDSDSTQSFEDVQMQLSSGTLQSNNSQEDDLKSSNKCNTKRYQYSPPHSNDEIETTTSSDIEIISNPNGDSSSQNSASRNSPLKLRKSVSAQAAGTTLLKKGHQREPSEISILSEDSQTEFDKLQHRISELNDILEAREQRLLQSERQNAELQERHTELQATLEALRSSNAGLDYSTEEYTQRLSALEKKFQASIRERDALRIQLKTLKEELQNKIPKHELDQLVAENNTMITELRLEGEKLSKEILQQSNIIKKLRAKEKSSDALIKKNKDEIQSQSEELERLKKTLNAKDEMERTQIEAVHKISSEKRKLEEENAQQSSKIDDLQAKLNTLQASFDAVKSELQQRVRLHTDLTRTSEEAAAMKKAHETVQAENLDLQRQVLELREQLRSTEQQARKREQQLRDDKQNLRQQLVEADLRAESNTQDISLTTVPLMRQLESLQNTLSQRTASWNQQEEMLLQKLSAAQTRLKSMELSESSSQEKLDSLQQRYLELEDKFSKALLQEEELKIALQQSQLDNNLEQTNLRREIAALKETVEEREQKIAQLNKKLEDQQQFCYKKEDSVSHEMLQRQYSNESETLQQQQIQQRSHSSAESTGVNSVEEALGGVDWPVDDFDCISNSGRTQTAPSLIYGMNLNFAGNNTTTLEHLQSLLKQRDGELAHLQWELSRLQAERAVLNEEISQLTLEMENLKEKLQILENLEQQYGDLQHRYDAVLQMYGEKVERTEELELDLIELKEAYKAQITELLSQQQRPST